MSVRSREIERGLARSSRRRSPQAGDSFILPAGSSTLPSSTPSISETLGASSTSSAVPISIRSSESVRVLAGIVTVLAVAVLGLFAWKIRSWRIKHRTAPSSLIKDPRSEKRQLFSKVSLKDLELGKSRSLKSGKPYVLPPGPPTPDLDADWTPRITPWRPPSAIVPDDVTSPEPAKHRYPRIPNIKETLRRMSFMPTERIGTPPPTYYVANGMSSPALTPLPRSSTSSPFAAHNALPATPPPPASPTPPPLKVKITPPTPQSGPGSALMSPKRVDSKPSSPDSVPALSITPKTPKSGNSVSSRANNRPPSPKRLPRLVKVVITFTPLEHDELACEVGDTLRLLEEYEDEWCLVQRVGREDAEKGVVPRFCVQDRAGVIPSYWGPYFASQNSYGASSKSVAT